MNKVSKVSQKKKEYSKVLNEIFETDIDWTKLSLNDLEKLTGVLEDQEKVIKVFLKLVDIEELIEKFGARILKEILKKSSTLKTGLEFIKIAKNEVIEKL